MIFYQELLSEVFDEQFVEFCADSQNIEIDKNSESTLLKLKYLAHRGFKEYLGILQIWYSSRLQDEHGIYFSKLLQTLAPSATHSCQERVFSGYTYDCCFQFLKLHHDKQTEIRQNIQQIDGNDPIFQFKVNKCLNKRKRKLSDLDDELSSDSICDDENAVKFSRFSKLEKLKVSIPLELINSLRTENILNESEVPSTSNLHLNFTLSQVQNPMDVNKKTRKFLFPKSGEHQQNEFLQLIADRTRSSNPSNHFYQWITNGEF